MRHAYLVTGAESSGTRMMCRALDAAGAAWINEHGPHDTDRLGWGNWPDRVTVHRSVPHAERWPNLAETIRGGHAAGYEITSVVMFRNPWHTARSQVKHQHVRTLAQAFLNMPAAYAHILSQLDVIALSQFGAPAVPVLYRSLIADADYRAGLFDRLGLAWPETFELYDANVYPEP